MEPSDHERFMSMPKLKRPTSADVDFCGHVRQGEAMVGALSMQVAESEATTSQVILCCRRCLVAGGEAVLAALQLESAKSKERQE